MGGLDGCATCQMANTLENGQLYDVEYVEDVEVKVEVVQFSWTMATGWGNTL